MRKACILMASPRKGGNTNALLKPFTDTLTDLGVKCDTFYLYDMKLRPCTACRVCQPFDAAAARRFRSAAEALPAWVGEEPAARRAQGGTEPAARRAQGGTEPAARRAQGDDLCAANLFGCPQEDDVSLIFDAILRSGLVVLASPIYSWYCTPPLKALLDRLVYGMNKFYGSIPGPALCEGKKMAIVTTCGYRPEAGADLWEEGVKRYCRHSHLEYAGMLAERHLGYDTVFMDEGKRRRAEDFARALAEKI